MARKNSQARSGSPKRDQLKSAGVDIDFEDPPATVIVSVVIKRP